MNSPKQEDKGNSTAIDFNDLLTNLRTSSSDFSLIRNELKDSKYNTGEYWYSMGSRLLIILNHHLYRAGGYISFSDYCLSELDYSRQHIYKLIRVAQFIDELWAQAANEDQRRNVKRLFALGFTKIYILQNLESGRLEHLLNNGVTVRINNLYPERQVSLEEATIEQLRQAIGYESAIEIKGKQSSSRVPIYQYNLIPLLKTHSQYLLQLIEDCQQDPVDPDRLKDQLQIMREYIAAIVDTIDALTGDLPHANSTME